MTKNKKKHIRRAQTLAPFGVGSIIDLDGESFVAMDIRFWEKSYKSDEVIHEPRLSRMLGVKYFRMAPAANDNQSKDKSENRGVPYKRFPFWLFCPSCRRMSQYFGVETPHCNVCNTKPKLVPMRFVVACPRGHLSDVPWGYWAHSQPYKKCESHKLKFFTQPGGSGLEYLFIKCETCGSSRSLKGIASKDSLRSLNIECSGKNPWDYPEDAAKCNAIPQVLQRGATNLTFAKIESSITIPTTEGDNQELEKIVSHANFAAIKETFMTAPKVLVDSVINKIAQDVGVDSEIVEQTIKDQFNNSAKTVVMNFDNVPAKERLLMEEYEALLKEGNSANENFLKRFVDLNSFPSDDADNDYAQGVNLLKDCLGKVVQVNRLREVRALKGFSRLAPSEDNQDEDGGRFSVYGSNKQISPVLVPADPRFDRNFNKKWLPAIEIFGEGIFLTLNSDKLQIWENDQSIKKRVARLIERKETANASYLPAPTPRLILLHSLAHLLIRQLSFECGYSISSLRERIYCSSIDSGKPMAGILIYTAAGDSEGTLGGLVRQGEPSRLLSVMMKALQNAEWCSSDPLCRESTGQGIGSLNLAACHSCSLLPETSCVMSNRLLDRLTLIGNKDDLIQGYFRDVLDFIIDSMS